MNKVIEIRKAIISSLKSAHPEVYFENPSSDAVFPYLVYDLPNSSDDAALETFILDVDGWDLPKTGDTTPLETLMYNVNQALNKKTVVVNNQFAMTFYLSNRLNLPDEDKRIKRRKYIYQIRTHEKNGGL